MKDYKKLITDIYSRYNPIKIHEVPNLLEKYKGMEEELLLKVYEKYNINLDYNDKEEQQIHYQAVEDQLSEISSVKDTKNTFIIVPTKDETVNAIETKSNNESLPDFKTAKAGSSKKYILFGGGAVLIIIIIVFFVKNMGNSNAINMEATQIADSTHIVNPLPLTVNVKLDSDSLNIAKGENQKMNDSMALAIAQSAVDTTGFAIVSGLNQLDNKIENSRSRVSGIENSNIDSVFTKVNEEAAFPGGEREWRKYLERNLNPSIPKENGAPEGTYNVVVQFNIDEEGKISDVKALTSHGYGMEEEAIKIIRRGPDWIPAIQSGRTVKADKRQSIGFMVSQE